MASSVIRGPYELLILYGTSNQRIKSIFLKDGDTIKTKYYSAGYEKEINDSITRELNYIYSPYGLIAIMIRTGESDSLYYAETDHLGSITGLMRANGTFAERYSYDAWGRRRNAYTWTYDSIPVSTLTDRGFTGHEHLDQLDLINMNGRMYDPLIGRFLSVDPVIQFPENGQNYNGYGYCLNNPLKYVDPSGYLLSAAEAYKEAKANGYQHSYSYFLSDYYQQYVDIYFDSMTGGGGGGRGGSYTMTFQYVGGHSETGKNGDYSEGCVWVKDKYVSSVTIDVGNFDFINFGASQNIITGDIAGRSPMIQSSFGAKVANGMAAIVDGAVIATELSPAKILPRNNFNNIAASASAGKIIAYGNNLLTWTAVAAEGIDLYNNQDKATKADYTKWSVNIGLAAAGTTILAVATFVPGVNVVAWGIALFGVTTANNFGAFDPLYQTLNK